MSFLKRLFRETPRGLNPGFSEAARLLSHADPPENRLRFRQETSN